MLDEARSELTTSDAAPLGDIMWSSATEYRSEVHHNAHSPRSKSLSSTFVLFILVFLGVIRLVQPASLDCVNPPTETEPSVYRPGLMHVETLGELGSCPPLPVSSMHPCRCM